ncbi:putative dehydrogenase [Cellulophaga sp. RHA19]|uniref:Gfo/Idh/MocA family protein n=1 Tax=Cellulophaga sp. RHA19 TaxID=1798237 RepID=UPI000C2C2857|nr:Gfo/Idh/MocA family oxidoreductase [Cellulophaga sp. RHA19]PKB44587.1 putative dehydrogenase [Cellulophaga sp. RHA19]
MREKIGWGIVGLGNIAEKFAKDLALVNTGKLVSISSRSKTKVQDFAAKHNVKNSYNNAQDLFNCADVDVVYIATPHTLHKELSIMAMNSGKHVLCEKPMGVNTKQVKNMIAASVKNNVFLMEALWSRFLPSIQKVKQIVDAKELGEISYIKSDFAFYGLDRAEESRLLNPNLAGGSLLDIGIYPVFLAYLLLGKPNEIIATANFYKTGVEKQVSIIFKYDNAQAHLYSALTANTETSSEIAGDKGLLKLETRWHEAEGYYIEKSREKEYFKTPKLGVGYTYEIEEVHKCITNNQIESKLWSHQNSLDLIQLLDQIREKTNIVFPFEA